MISCDPRMPSYILDGDGFLIETYHLFTVYNFLKGTAAKHLMFTTYV
jgi:hypothetical protein